MDLVNNQRQWDEVHIEAECGIIELSFYFILGKKINKSA